MQKKQLLKKDRDFFQLIQKAIFTNPFSDERLVVDRQILGLGSDEDIFQRENMLAAEVKMRLSKFKVPPHQYKEQDRGLLEYAYLFLIYHQYHEKFDNHINAQLSAGDEPLPVAFAQECIAKIKDGGIGQEDAVRYFSLFFQMRRAFFFINLIVGKSSSIKNLRLALWNNVFTHDIGLYNSYLWNRMEDFSTLILGETGTGKGMAATAIGRSGFIPFLEKKNSFAESFTRAFVAINLSQYPEELINSELFGHKKGAFTGAIGNHQGVFERCSPYGAIFLDEIGEISVPVQIKLLRVLEERTFSPVGSHQQKKFQGRIIAATNRKLVKKRQQGTFRDDFYYRLCSDTILVSSLRERLQEDPQELSRLLNITLERITGRSSQELSKNVEKILSKTVRKNYHWPGNGVMIESGV